MFGVLAAVFLVTPVLQAGAPAQSCAGHPLVGVVRDTTGALVPGAALSLDGGTTRMSGPDGRFRFPCVSAGRHAVTATFTGFGTVTMEVTMPHSGEINLRLVPSAEASVTVDADEEELQASPPGGGERDHPLRQAPSVPGGRS